MPKLTKTGVIVSVVLVAVLVALLIRAANGHMAKPWPERVEITKSEPVKNDFGLVVGQKEVTHSEWSWKGFWVWVGAFFTLAIMSFLYADNPFYKFAEHVFVGVSAAYWMVIGFWQVLVPNLFGKLAPGLVSKIIPGLEGGGQDWRYLIPLALGILLLARLAGPKVGNYSRWALAFIVGTTAGLNFLQYLRSDFMSQIASSVMPLVVMNDGRFSAADTFGNIVVFVGVVCGLVYFFFSKEHTGVFGAASRVGIWILMVSFGASFGFTVMGRIALLVGRMEYLFGEWLRMIG